MPLQAQADDLQKFYRIECDDNKNQISVLPEHIFDLGDYIWKYNRELGRTVLDPDHVEEFKKKGIYVPNNLEMSCLVAGRVFTLRAEVPVRNPSGRCGYNPNGKITVDLDKKRIIDAVSFNEGCMSYASLTKMILYLEGEPELNICIKKGPGDMTETCLTIGTTSSDFTPLTQQMIGDLSNQPAN